MATLCKNCNHALIYDPGKKMMLCVACGSTFAAEQVESEAKKYRENERLLKQSEVYGEETEKTKEEFLECYVYTCSECGGEIVIHGTEVSTHCVYCGNPTVVFSRVTKEKKPNFILPFSVTRETALNSIRYKIGTSIFVPKAVRNFQPDDVLGIYLPFWLVNANYYETCVVRSEVGSGKSKETRYWGRTGNIEIKDLPVDGCRMLSDESSMRLEPFPLKSMKNFDEDYLLGFYSNASDINYNEMYQAVESRAKEHFEESVVQNVEGSSRTIDRETHQTSIKDAYKYAMFPVWFVTFTYKGKHNTILVNGRTGKVVCGLPWRKGLFAAMTIGIGSLVALMSYFLFYGILSICLQTSPDSAGEKLGSSILAVFVLAILGFFSAGIRKMSRVLKQINRTQSSETFNFVKKRKE